MARKKRSAVTKQHGQSDSPLFKLPGELRNRIYDLVFEHDNEAVSIRDAFSPLGKRHPNAAPPSSALLRACRKLHHESKVFHAVAYRNYWRKSFVIDLREVDALRGYIMFVPTLWIDNYIMKVKNKHTNDTEVLLSRSGGHWHAKAKSAHPYNLTNCIIAHTKACLGKIPWEFPFCQGNMVSDGYFDLMFGPRCSPQNRRRLFVLAGLMDRNQKQSSKTGKKFKAKYKRPQRPTQAPDRRRTNPKCGPLSENERRAILKNRMAFPQGMAPLTKSELLRILQPRMGLTLDTCPNVLKRQAALWEHYMTVYSQ